MRRDHYERVVLALAAGAEAPFAFVDRALDEFDTSLEAEPTELAEDVIERRARELLEEVA